MRLLTTLAFSFALVEGAVAGPLLDYIRTYDLNDYAFGIAIAVEENPYTGAETGTFAYPYLTSFRDSALTNDWLLVRDGDVGLRWISEDGDWELGAVARLQTLGLGNSDAPELTVSAWDDHPNEVVHRIAAEEIYRRLIDQRLIPLSEDRHRGSQRDDAISRLLRCARNDVSSRVAPPPSSRVPTGRRDLQIASLRSQ